MIKFFRNIRRRLLRENKFIRYLIYAVGEIILVVIGILIALQINNSNQNRVDRKFEKTMLTEIRKSLETDSLMHELLTQRAKVKEEGIDKLLFMISSNNIYADSTLLKIYNDMSLRFLFNYSKGGYEGLRSSGLDKIINDSLRNNLIQTYEMWFPRLEDMFALLNTQNSIEANRLKLHNALWKRTIKQLPNGERKIVSTPINRKTFLKQTELIDIIKIEQDHLDQIQSRLNSFKTAIYYCLANVNKELKKNNR